MGVAGLGGAGDKLCGAAGQTIANLIGVVGGAVGGAYAGGEGKSATRGKTASQITGGVTSAWVEGCAARTANQQTDPAVGGGGTQDMNALFREQARLQQQLAQQNYQMQTANLERRERLEDERAAQTRMYVIGGVAVVGVLGVLYFLVK